MAINKEILDIAKAKIGSYLKDIRKDKKLTQLQVCEVSGLTERQVIEIERGSTQYTVDSFLAYISAIDCYFYLADKAGKHLDTDDMVSQSKNPI